MMNEKMRIIKKVINHYHKIPFHQDEIRKANFKNTLTYYVLKNYDLRNKQICDVGCSTSFIGRYVTKNFPGYNYLGVDINFKALRIAKQQGVNVILSDNLKLSLPDEFSDFTISEGVIHHTPDPYKCFKELIRITKKGGLISLFVYNKKNYYHYLYKFSWFIRKMYEQGSKFSHFLIYKVFFPIYTNLYLKIGRRLSGLKFKILKEEALAHFHDQILTPVAHFFSEEEIISFARQNKLKVLRTKKTINGQGLMFLFKKL